MPVKSPTDMTVEELMQRVSEYELLLDEGSTYMAKLSKENEELMQVYHKNI